MGLIDRRLDSIEAYVEHFSSQPLPVLRHTVRALDELREHEDSVSARAVANVVLHDPLMAMRVITFLEQQRRKSQNHDITTIDRAIMMMGVSPFFRAFSDLPKIEEHLSDRPKALLGLVKVINRARRASHFARDWAVVRHDLDVEEITLAALLRQATEILCWAHAPALALGVQYLQARDPALRTADAQRQVFGCTAAEIQQALIRAWRLPQLLANLLDESQADHPRVQNITLASRLARHAAGGWDNPALPDDFAAITELLHIGLEPLLKRLGVPQEDAQKFLPQEPPDSI